MKKRAGPKGPKASKAEVAIVMGSDSDMPVMNGAAEALSSLGIPFRMEILSAHRTPAEVASFAQKARGRGLRVIIAGAGGAAHLPGMIAAYTELPVVGVPVPIGALRGRDALLSIVQMPRGVPVATVAIGNAWNAGVLAAQIIGSGSPEILDRIADYKKKMRADVMAKNETIQQ
jgi:phosphoribosylaminoimidazole carboxylase PurE protein